ncbi:MAG: hypothetical protein IMZ61_15020 [Planctomycetes bacterium]|nr:hypothetical protein [Planctomycetota bacterium]
MKVLQLRQAEYPDGGGVILESFDHISGQLGDVDMQEIGDSFLISIVDMTREQLDALPEWDGF